ncbi:hypothetical protein [Luteimonas cellulosilyticus]|uniref:hypothetical protein n=2 Tax=Luteimonas TaxID=83614 RepID=UPI001F440EFE|nr:hypothetical protein [Luteimonas cellulosilyticus]
MAAHAAGTRVGIGLTTLTLACALAACEGAPPADAAMPAALPVATADTAAVAANPSPEGRYALRAPRSGTLTLDDADGVWRITLQGGTTPSDGAGVAADCDLQAEGPLEDGRIDAVVVPFETDRMAVTAAELATTPATVTVTLDGDTAVVATDFTLCAMRADLNGSYDRRSD